MCCRKCRNYYNPAYHCSKQGHTFRVPKAKFDQTILVVVNHLKVAPEKVDELLSAIEARWNEKQDRIAVDTQKVAERKAELEAQTKAILDRMDIVSSPVVIKHLEEEVVEIDKQIKALEGTIEQPDETVDMRVVLQYARYLVEHLSDILLRIRHRCDGQPFSAQFSMCSSAIQI